mmetsp:Transcript_13167/g.17341  ORF Transcript_13167/g.17341 Transcript_13167/m.17341 type:complete len:222 (+) Transcript_13167:1115-1780(+)
MPSQVNRPSSARSARAARFAGSFNRSPKLMSMPSIPTVRISGVKSAGCVCRSVIGSHLFGQVGHDRREKNDEDKGCNHQEKEWQRRAGNSQDIATGQRLQHKEIEANWWGNLRHLNHDHQENTEPERINPRLKNHGHDDRRREHHDGNPVKKTTKHDKEDRQCSQKREGREVERADPFRQQAGNAGKAHRNGQKGRAGKDEGNHAGRHGSAHETVDKGTPG